MKKNNLHTAFSGIEKIFKPLGEVYDLSSPEEIQRAERKTPLATWHQFPPRERLVTVMTEGYKHGVPAMDAALQSLLCEIPIAEMTYTELHHYLVKLRDTYER